MSRIFLFLPISSFLPILILTKVYNFEKSTVGFGSLGVDKFIVKSKITSNKLQDIQTVSQVSRHRSNHTQKSIHSVVAGHQFLQFGCIGPLRMWDIQASAWKHISLFSKCSFHQNCLFGNCCLPLASSSCASSSSVFRRHTKASSAMLLRMIWTPHFHFSERALQFAIIPGKSDIIEVTGFITASVRIGMLIGFSSEITGALFSASSLWQSLNRQAQAIDF